jgi:flagellar basal body-associated protein FliL
MKTIALGVLVILFAVGLMFYFLVFPSVIDLDDAPWLRAGIEPLVCTEGESLEIERTVTSPRAGETSYSAEYFCDSSETARRDVTEDVLIIGIVGFIVLLSVGILLTIIGSMMAAARTVRSAQQALAGVSFSAVPGQAGFTVNVSPGTSVRKVTTDATSTNQQELLDMLKNFGDGGAEVLGIDDRGADATGRLKDLEAAYQAGLITKDEYEAKRKEIIRRI